MESHYTIGEAQRDGLLTLYPLLLAGEANDGGADWLSLAEAVTEGLLEITEVDEGGVVGELIATNRAPSPVLILDGEQLIGAKQNRTTSRTILVAASSATRIPVSCMEQGRWRHRSATMRSGEWHSPSKVRRHARRVEADAARERRPEAAEADPSRLLSMAQADVWASIRDSSARARVHSQTGALDEVYDRLRSSLDSRATRFPRLPGQVGFVAFAGATALGMDVVADPGTFARLHDRLVRGYLFDVVEREAERELEGGSSQDEAPSPDAGAVEALLAEIAAAPREPLRTAGLGEYRVLAGAVVGGELEWEGKTVHLSAFAGA